MGIIMGLCLTATPVLAEEVLYCADTGATCFSWNSKSVASRTTFDNQRFTIKVVSDAKRIITLMAGASSLDQGEYDCNRPNLIVAPERLVCADASGTQPWVFYRNTYTHAFLAEPPTGKNADPNIMVAYGTCTKF